MNTVSLELHTAIVRGLDAACGDLRSTNAALAERVQELEAALDKAADELAHHGNVTFRIMDECGLPGSDQRSVYDRCKHIADTLKAAQDDAARLRSALEEVEWTAECYCPWCGVEMGKGHRPDCQRQAALAQTSEVKA